MMKMLLKLILNILLRPQKSSDLAMKNLYNHYDRTHYGLGKDTPFERSVQPRPAKDVKEIESPRVGGLHHRYAWKKV